VRVALVLVAVFASLPVRLGEVLLTEVASFLLVDRFSLLRFSVKTVFCGAVRVVADLFADARVLSLSTTLRRLSVVADLLITAPERVLLPLDKALPTPPPA
jgi:hypothetical protein